MAYNWTTGRWELDNSTGFDWTKAFNSNNKYGIPWQEWYSGIIDYNPNKYPSYYDATKLVDGDLTNNYDTPWSSQSPSKYDTSRYSPTSGFGNFGVGGQHYNYAKGVESQPYYQQFTKDLFNSDGSFSSIGLQWAKSVDALLPPSAKAKYSFFDNDGKLRNEWSPVINNSHGQTALQYRQDQLKEYVEHLRNDQIIGPRHNLFLKKGTRYFYKDKNGNEHWVDPTDVSNYVISEKPVRNNFENNVFWDDYEITGLKPAITPSVQEINKNGAPVVSSIYGTTWDPSKITLSDKNQFEVKNPVTLGDFKITSPTVKTGGSQEVGDGDDPKLLPWYKREGWVNLFNRFKNNLPNLIEGARYAGQIVNNRKVYEDSLKGIRPNLIQSYNTYRQVVGDEASKQAYYRRGAEGVTRASQPFTSDADRQMAYQMEAQRQANELQAQGDLIDNQRIRETSELSAQHADANRQRATEVANQNIAQINVANQAKWNLSAQRRAADWASTNNLLLGYENRLRQKVARREAIQNQIDTLNTQTQLENDPILQQLQKEYNELLKDPANQITYGTQTYPNYESDAVKNKLKEIKNRQKYLTIQILQQRLKSGGKVTYKQKDDLLYKTARDVVKHFREMTRLTDNSYQKSRKKVPKLVPHPTKKLQQGGVAPFGVFTPLAMGGEYSQTAEVSSTGTRSSSSSKSSADDKSKDLLNLAKDLFSKMEGLPIDVSSVYAPISNLLNRVRYSGEELSSHEIATIYLQSMTQLSALKHNQKIYEAAKTQAINNDALDEFVITNGGKIVSQNVEDGSLKALSFDEIAASEGKYNPLTNNNLLELRAHDPKFAFDSNILRYVSDTVGINKVTDQIKKLAGNIGTDEVQQQGYSKKQADNIVKGLELLQNKNAALQLQNAPDGDYEYTETRKSQQNQMNAALNFILTTLPRNMQNTLQAYADMHKVKPTDIIIQGLASQLDSTYELKWNAITGKAAKDANGNSGSDSSKATFNDMVQRGQIGIPREFSIITRDGQTKFYSSDSKYVSQLPEVSSDTSIAQMLSESKIGQILDSRLGITFGDQVINSENLKDIMFSVGGGATFVTLPCKYENGHKVVNFAIKDEFDDAIKEASKTTPIDWTDDNFKKNLANILKQKGLDNLLTSSMDIDPNMLGLFLVVEGYTTDRINFNKNSKYIEKINNPDKELENRLNEALSVKGLDGKVQKYDVDINDWNLGFLFEGGWDDIYHANVFIPLNNDPLSAQIGNDTFKRDDARDLAREKQNYLKLINAKNTNSNQLNYETE